MNISVSPSSTVAQYLAAFFGSLSAFCAGSSFVWVTPLLPRLRTPGGSEIYLSLGEASWVVSLIEIGNLFSPIPVAFLVDKLGRKPALLSTAPMYIVTWLLVLFTRSVPVLYIMRIIQGVSLGIVYTVLPMYLGEIAEPKLRGTLSVFFIGMWFLGILSVYAIGPYVSYQNLTWFCFVPPVVYLLTFWYFPESPYFLLMKGKQGKAAKALNWLRMNSDEEKIRQELLAMSNAIQEEAKSEATWKDIFLTRSGRKSLLLVQLVAMTQIMAGFMAVLTYATETFSNLASPLLPADHITLIIGATAMIVTLVSGGLVDRAGRRPVLLISAVGSFIMLAATSVYFLVLEKYPFPELDSVTWIPYVTLVVFVGVMNFGLAALLPTLQAELFPTSTRGIASGITALNICIMSFVVLEIYLPIQESVGLFLNYAIYAVFAALGAILLAIFLPETKGKSFAEIQQLL